MKKTDKGYIGLPMEGWIASWYAKNTLKDIRRHRLLAQEIAGLLPPGSRVLEVAPGPGYFCIELARLGNYQITGLDISRTFVEIARVNAADAGLKVDFRQGNAAEMSLPDGSADFIVCQAAFKNFSQPVRAMREMHRVLSPGGTALIVDLRRDASLEDIRREVSGMGLDGLNAWLTRWIFRTSLLKRAYTKEEIAAFAVQTPFESCKIEESGISFRAWLGKAPVPGI